MPDGEPEPSEHSRRETSRRDFLRAAGYTAAGAGVGAALGYAGYQTGLGTHAGGAPSPLTAPIDPTSHPAFAHIVVLMAENRSFDNLLGWLYTPEDLSPGETFEGLAFGDYANVALNGTRIPAYVYGGQTVGIMQSPDPDPGEEYPHVNTQLFNRIDPRSNDQGDVARMSDPFNVPQYNPPNPETAPPHPANVNKDKPPTSPAQGILGLLIAKYDPGRKLPQTYAEAYATLHALGNGVFGTGPSS